jgi:hypothetical protein
VFGNPAPLLYEEEFCSAFAVLQGLSRLALKSASVGAAGVPLAFCAADVRLWVLAVANAAVPWLIL